MKTRHQHLSAGPQEGFLRHYLLMFRKWFWLILSVVCVIVTITLIDTARTRPVYQATVRLIIEREHPHIIPFDEAIGRSPVIDPMVSYSSYYQTQYKLLQSRSLAQRVIQSLDLQDHPDFRSPRTTPGLFAQIQQWPRGLVSKLINRLRPAAQIPPTSPATPPQRSQAALVTSFLGRLKVMPIPDTRLVDVSFTAHDPKLAAQVANTLARIHIDHNLETRFAASQEAVDWLNLRVQDIRAKVEKAEIALQAYKKKHGTVSLQKHENVVVQQLAELNSALTEANTKVIEVQTLHRELERIAQQPSRIDALPLVIHANNKLVHNLRSEYASLRYQTSELQERFGSQHPIMLEITAKMQSLENEIRSEVKKIIRGVATDTKVASARLNALQTAFEQKKEEAQQLNTIGIGYGVLQRDAESNRQLYNALLTSMKQTSVSAELKRNNIRMVDAAEVPSGAIRPRPMSNLMRAALVALLLGCGLAWLLESLNTAVQTPEEAEQLLQLPVLGVIGQFRHKSVSARQSESSLIAIESPHSQPAEAFRTLRTNLLMSRVSSAHQVLVITSPLPRDGKTTVAANLAVVMAQSGRRVLLIDADLRHPKLHRMFAVDEALGLSSILLNDTYERILAPRVKDTTLHLIPAGACPSNPLELLGSERMQRFIRAARQRFDVVILDTPPVLAVSDALVASGLADGVIAVVRAGATPKGHAKRMLAQLSDVQSHFPTNVDGDHIEAVPNHKILGVVVNGLKPRDGSAYYGRYGHYYQSGPALEDKAA